MCTPPTGVFCVSAPSRVLASCQAGAGDGMFWAALLCNLLDEAVNLFLMCVECDFGQRYHSLAFQHLRVLSSCLCQASSFFQNPTQLLTQFRHKRFTVMLSNSLRMLSWS